MLDNKLRLTNINLKGYKSISGNGQDIPIGEITILLGANGAGKSNLVSFFQMLNFMTTGALQTYIGISGYANSLLYYGSKKTARLESEITFSDNSAIDKYGFTLSHVEQIVPELVGVFFGRSAGEEVNTAVNEIIFSFPRSA